MTTGDTDYAGARSTTLRLHTAPYGTVAMTDRSRPMTVLAG
jgi:hypothetical protein